jgi:glycerophosphoryl diester phosphodiesterase
VCAAENPENTVAAVEAATSVADAVEVDVRRCATGELVVFHDETLDRLTAETGRVDETSRSTLSTLGVDGSGEHVPRLKEGGLVDDLLTLHAEYEHDVTLSSFHPAVLEEAREADPAVPTARIVRESVPNRALRPLLPGLPGWLYGPEDVDGTIEETLALGCEAIHPRYELCLQTDLVAEAHDAGLRVEPWTVATKREVGTLRAVGVDAVISDVCAGLVDRSGRDERSS